jgi:hypothetical protein
VHLRIAYLGREAEGARLVEPLRALGPRLIDTVDEQPFTAFAGIHLDPVEPIPAYERTAQLCELPVDLVDTVLRVAGPDAAYPVTMTEIRHVGGALGRPPESPNAVTTRDADFNLFLAAIAAPDEVATAKTAMDQLIRRTLPWHTGGAFANFLASDDLTPDRVAMGYDRETYERLRRAKQTYDAGNMFRVNHNIPPIG